MWIGMHCFHPGWPRRWQEPLTPGPGLSTTTMCICTAVPPLPTPKTRLGALADNGGSTRTHLQLAGSVGLNQISSGTNGCGTTYTTDQRGITRPALGLCDIGAVEGQCIEMGYTFPYTVGTGANTDNVQDLRTTVACANNNGTADTISFAGDIALSDIDNVTDGNI